MGRDRGLTLIELLVAFILLTLISVMIYRGYISVIRETSRIYYVAKDEKEVRTFIYQLIKDIKSAGFGVGKSEIDNTGNGVLSSCQFPTTNVPVLSKCTDANNNDQLYILSLSSRNIRESGCWGFVDSEGCLRVAYVTKIGERVNLSQNLLSRDCSSDIRRTGRFLFLSKERRILGGGVESGSNVCVQSAECDSGIKCSYKNSVFVYFGDNDFTYPDDFQVRYYLSPNNIPVECAPNTYNLVRQLRGGVGQPILSCVATFKVYYGESDDFGSMLYSASIGSIDNLKSVVLCMVVQLGRHKAGKPTESVTFSNKCGGFTVSFNDERRFYRWKVVEEEVPLRNIGAITVQEE